MSPFADDLRQLRFAHGLRQQQLAALMNVSERARRNNIEGHGGTARSQYQLALQMGIIDSTSDDQGTLCSVASPLLMLQSTWTTRIICATTDYILGEYTSFEPVSARMEAASAELGKKIAAKEAELSEKDRRLAEAGRSLQELSARYRSALLEAKTAESETHQARINEAKAQTDAVVRYAQLRAQLYGEALSTLQICPLRTQFGTKDFELGLKADSLDECLAGLRRNSPQWLTQLSPKDAESFTSAASWAAHSFRAEHVSIVDSGNAQLASLLEKKKLGPQKDYELSSAVIQLNSEVTAKYVALMKKVRSAIAKRSSCARGGDR